MTWPFSVAGPLLFLVLWGIVSWSGVVDSFFVPNPLSTLRSLLHLSLRLSLLADAASTCLRVFFAFTIAMVSGIPAGLLLGSSRRAYGFFAFAIDFFRSMPATALFPLFLLLFGVSDATKILLAAFSSFLIIAFTTAHGVLSSPRLRIVAARMMGASRLRIFFSVTFWNALPSIVVGLRHAVSLSLVVIVVTEMFIGSQSGLGRRIIDAQISYDIPVMYAVILLTGLIGYAINLVFVGFEAWVERRSGI